MMSCGFFRIERRRAVLTDGSISGVAGQRSDFRGLLTAGDERKSVSLAGTMSG
jgi:hypothetical protein